MTDLDLARMSDRELLAYIVLGDIPRRGWPGRNRAIARRALSVAGLTVVVIAILIAVLALIVVLWAARP